MITNDQSSRGAAVTSADEIGKVFVALGQGMRQCLVCGDIFTRQAAPEHAGMVCHPGLHCALNGANSECANLRAASDYFGR